METPPDSCLRLLIYHEVYNPNFVSLWIYIWISGFCWQSTSTTETLKRERSKKMFIIVILSQKICESVHSSYSYRHMEHWLHLCRDTNKEVIVSEKKVFLAHQNQRQYLEFEMIKLENT